MSPSALVIGAGPAGLMAADVLAGRGFSVELRDRMPSPARKFLRAGIGGLNLTHSEPFPAFLGRYGTAADWLRPMLEAFGPDQVRAWADGLGCPTFVGTSGRVFPVGMKAAPLLRAWLRRLDGMGVRFRMNSRWLGWDETGALLFDDTAPVRPDITILGLGGASWPRLGSDGGWAALLAALGIGMAPFRPANCGFEIAWSPFFAEKFAGQPVKAVGLSFGGRRIKGEFVVTRTGIEGSAIYALSAPLRDAIEQDGRASLMLDLKPDWSQERLAQELASPRGSRSLATHLDKAARLKGVMVGLLREGWPELPQQPDALAAAIKAVPVSLNAARPLAEAISTAGGIRLDELDDRLMLKRLPGVYAAGEMLDWEAPTGGYLLTACLAQGYWAGLAAAGGP